MHEIALRNRFEPKSAIVFNTNGESCEFTAGERSGNLGVLEVVTAFLSSVQFTGRSLG